MVESQNTFETLFSLHDEFQGVVVEYSETMHRVHHISLLDLVSQMRALHAIRCDTPCAHHVMTKTLAVQAQHFMYYFLECLNV